MVMVMVTVTVMVLVTAMATVYEKDGCKSISIDDTRDMS
jgi:hypothetical protein